MWWPVSCGDQYHVLPVSCHPHQTVPGPRICDWECLSSSPSHLQHTQLQSLRPVTKILTHASQVSQHLSVNISSDQQPALGLETQRCVWNINTEIILMIIENIFSYRRWWRRRCIVCSMIVSDVSGHWLRNNGRLGSHMRLSGHKMFESQIRADFWHQINTEITIDSSSRNVFLLGKESMWYNLICYLIFYHENQNEQKG